VELGKQRHLFLVLGALLAIGGCATVTTGSMQPIKVETITADGKLISGAECQAANQGGVFVGSSGALLSVRRSGDHLELECKHAAHSSAEGRVISRLNAATFGNVIAGGGIGTLVDQASGAAYTYPSWIRLVFGKSLVFDRAREVPGQPELGREPGTAQ
jgi:hypothetical protein